MLTRTPFLHLFSLSLGIAMVTLLWLFSAPQAAYAQASPTDNAGGGGPLIFTVDRTDDDATAQACTADPNDCSLRGAVIRANQATSSTIILESNQIYTLTIPPAGANDATTGDLNLTADILLTKTKFPGQTIIRSGGPASQWPDRILRVENSARVAIYSLTMQAGGVLSTSVEAGGALLVTGNAHLDLNYSTLDSSQAQRGGGLAVDAGSATLLHTTISHNNAALAGGGVWVGAAGSLQLTDCLIRVNQAGSGGGITNLGTLTIAATILAANRASDGSLGGGALDNQGESRLERSWVSSNEAASGGAIRNQKSLIIDNTQIFLNKAISGNGGALLNQSQAAVFVNRSYLGLNEATAGNGGAIWNAGRLTLIGATLAENRTTALDSQGGGIFHHSGELAALNSTISSNRVEGDGGGLYVAADGQGSLTHVTIAENVGLVAGGLVSLNPSFRISNTLLAQNYIFLGYNDCSGSFTSEGYNLLARNQCTRLGAATNDLIDLFEVHLGHLQDNGGFQLTHALLPGSPALNSGSPDSCPPVDQRELARPQAGRCDIGAFEAAFYFMPLITQ